MVSPDILGASAGVSFGAALAVLLGLGSQMTQVLGYVMDFYKTHLNYELTDDEVQLILGAQNPPEKEAEGDAQQADALAGK